MNQTDPSSGYNAGTELQVTLPLVTPLLCATGSLSINGKAMIAPTWKGYIKHCTEIINVKPMVEYLVYRKELNEWNFYCYDGPIKFLCQPAVTHSNQ